MKTKTYVITGSTSGIGKATVEALGEDNIIFAGYRDEKKLADFTQFSNIIPFYIDMENSESIKNAAEFIKSKTNKIDTLINVAGCVVAGAVEEIDINTLRKQFEVNTFSHLDLTQRLLPLLKGGKIINISSMASFGVFPLVAPYCASKRALDILFNSLQVEYGNDIKYVSIKPGAIATPLWGKSIDNNMELLADKEKYSKEYNFLMENARKNEVKGLDVKEVVKTILKADSKKHPKASYLVGKDAIAASILSYFPQVVINKILQIGMKLRIK